MFRLVLDLRFDLGVVSKDVHPQNVGYLRGEALRLRTFRRWLHSGEGAC